MVVSVSIGVSDWSVLIANLDAISPPACPPIPSATAIKEPETNAESSLPLRTKPNAERALLSKKKPPIRGKPNPC